MAQIKGRLTEEIPRHRVLREVYRHYLEFRQYVSNTGNHVIEHGYFIYDDNGEVKDKIIISISFWDLFNGLKDLSPRKREAVWYNVILDQKQRDVAEKMKITTVSVGQYVEQAMIQLAERYFAETSTDEAADISGLGKDSEEATDKDTNCIGTNPKKPQSMKRAKIIQTIS